MRRIILAVAFCCISAPLASAQEYVSGNDVGMPGVMYSGSIGAGYGGQLYPYDRQEPWLHGHFQRMPAYGGFASFRPYNYRHVFAQRQIATNVWGSAHGLPYSQQFWNRYRTDYLNGNLHSEAAMQPAEVPMLNPGTMNPISHSDVPASATAADGRPISVFPADRLAR